MPHENATFYTFKPSGKWKYSGRGYAMPMLWERFTHVEQRAQILKDNNNCVPGMNSDGEGLIIVVIPDENCPHGWPLHINP